MQELRQQCSERSPVVAIGKNAGVKMGNHLVRKRDLGLRPLAGAQRDVATCYFGVGALARGHGSDDVDLFVSRAPPACATPRGAMRIYVAYAHAPQKSACVGLQPK